jgi:WD40 repeat protein
MLERRKFIKNHLNKFIPNDLSNLISEYDYYFIGESKPILENPNGYAYCCAVLSNDQEIRLVTKSNGHSIGIWNMQTEIRELSLEDNISIIHDCFVLSDGRIATRSYYNTLKIWNPFGSTEQPEGLFRQLRQHRQFQQSKTGECDITFEGESIRCCASLTNELLVTGTIHGTLKIWRIKKQTKKCVLSINAHSGWITHCIALYGSLIVSGSDNGELKIWNIYETLSGNLTDILQKKLEGHTDGITCCAALPNGYLISGSHDKTLRVWNVITGKCKQILKGHTDSVFCCANLHEWLPERIISGSYDGLLKIWNLQTGNCELSLKGYFEDSHSKCIDFCSVLPDGRLITGSSGRLKIWR